jgi:F-type H+-transporting ATPase subunit alpha
VAEAAGTLARAVAGLPFAEALAPRGVVERVGDGVAFVGGLDGVGYEEIVLFDGGARGMAFDLREGTTGVVLLDGGAPVGAGMGVLATGRLPEVPVGRATLGRVIDPLGRPLEGVEPLAGDRLPLFRPAPELIERKAIDQPLWTGIAVLDAAIPIGRGQRELVIGDRNVGKTALAIDVLTAQRPNDVACVYVAIAQPMSRVLALRDALLRRGHLANTAIVAADAAATPGMRYLAPYAGASVAEWFRDQGGDALVVYDDLTKHADAYRELALLLDRPPGREAYPGDVFYLHAELLERAAARGVNAGGGSVTALPIVETTDGDLAAYIPTNVISITDGQIHLDTGRFERNERPAVDVGRSVSRIGGAAQPPAMRLVARNLRVLHARFEQLEALVRVGLEIDAAVQREITRGRILRALLRQGQGSPRGIAEQVLALLAVSDGWLDRVPADDVPRAVTRILDHARAQQPAIVEALDAGTVPEGEWQASLRAVAARTLEEGMP